MFDDEEEPCQGAGIRTTEDCSRENASLQGLNGVGSSKKDCCDCLEC